MNMEYDFVPAPTDAKEFEQWRKEQAKIIEEQEHKITIYKIVAISSVVLSIVSVALSIIL